MVLATRAERLHEVAARVSRAHAQASGRPARVLVPAGEPSVVAPST